MRAAPRRLIFSGVELEALRLLTGGPRLPADFRIALEQVDLPGLTPSLLQRGLVVEDPDAPGRHVVHPSIAAELAVLSAPELLVETRVGVGEGAARQALRAAHAVAGPLGASLVRGEEGAGVELSVFAATDLGREVARVVPDARRPGAGDARPPEGVVLLEALVELPIAATIAGPAVVTEVAADLGVGDEERELAVRLARDRTGVLQATLAVPARSGQAAFVGGVLWYATDRGWVGVAPEPGEDGRTVARLVATEPADLPGWLGPLVGQALVEAGR